MFDIKRHDSRIRPMSELGIPVVLVGNPEDPSMLHCVDVDYSQVAHLAADELVRTGASRVVAVSDFVDKQDFAFVQDFEGIRSAVAANMSTPVTNVSPQAAVVSRCVMDTVFLLPDGRPVPQLRQFIAPTFTRRDTTPAADD